MSANERADKDPLEVLIARYLASEHSEQTLDRGDLLAQHPELADSLREFFANHDRMKALFGGQDLTLAAGDSGPAGAKEPIDGNRQTRPGASTGAVDASQTSSENVASRHAVPLS